MLHKVIARYFGLHSENLELGKHYELVVEVLPSGIINVHIADSLFLNYKGVEDIEQAWKEPTDRTDRVLTWEALIDIWNQELKTPKQEDESNSELSGQSD